MSLSITFNCPVCAFEGRGVVRVGTRTVNLLAAARAQDVDGDFARDPSQHVHYDDAATPTCPNGHKLSIEAHITVGRRA